MAATKQKFEDSKWIKVKVTSRNPEAEAQSGFVGSNMVVINGKPNIRHYRFQLDKEVELPEICVDQLKRRSMIGKDKKGNRVNVPLYLVEGA